ncbi:MAG: endopeptidase La [Polyangiales bacterium]
MTQSFDGSSLQDLPLLPLRKGLVLPGRKTTLPIGRSRSLALGRSLKVGDEIVIAVQHAPEVEAPALADMHSVAVVAVVRGVTNTPRRGFFLVVEGKHRVRLEELVAQTPFIRARVSLIADVDPETDETKALADSLRARVAKLGVDKALAAALENAQPTFVADRVTAWVEAPQEQKLEVLHEVSVTERLRLVARMVSEAKSRAELRSRVDSEVRREMSKAQREQVLRGQMRAIQKELGQLDGDDEDPNEVLARAIEAAGMPEEAKEQADRELRRLRGMPAQAPEANVIRTYLETLTALPWEARAEAVVDLDELSAALDRDHYAMGDVKQRILEHMAVLQLAPEARGTVLCLLGPPGVGKTSLAQSVADATGRPLVRVSLGGVRDEAEIRGHRRTYIGAMPGRIMTALRKAKVKNPVIVLDEVDKVTSGGWSGDPQAALLELLDPEQNERFQDHYVDTPFDLSEALFIATANDLSKMSLPLRDRLEILEVSGYTIDEKVQIAARHLFGEQIERHGLNEEQVSIDEETLSIIVKDYTRESGVRRLKQQIAKVLRRVALRVARGSEGEDSVAIDEAFVREALGKPRFFLDPADKERMPGVAAGLAWTPVGGDVLYVETTRMPGKGKLEITGQLGDVMTESARAALAYLRTHAAELDIEPTFLEEWDLHVHVPAGATPKDGPSAGVTMYTAFASLLTGRRVCPNTAMTGEATLRGRVLPVGGIKEKVLAAHRAGFTRIVLPKRNGVDLDDVPESVRDELEFVLVDRMSEVIEVALEEVEGPGGVHAPLGNIGGNEGAAPVA